jgi:uncharacterized membrane protein
VARYPSLREQLDVWNTARPSRQPIVPWSQVRGIVDGVYGFAATLLAYKIVTPSFRDGHLSGALRGQLPAYGVILAGGLLILMSWTVWRRFMSYTIGTDGYGMMALFVSVLMYTTAPFSIDLLSQSLDNEADFVAALRLFGVVLFVGALAQSLLVWRADRLGAWRPEVDPSFVRVISHSLRWASPLNPLAAVALSFVAGYWAVLPILWMWLWCVIPVEGMTTQDYASTELS